MPSQYPGLSPATYWAIGISSAFILFVSVLLHELSHSYIATRNGLPIARITLFFFGGVSEMSEEPKDPRLEVRMAAAGPLISFLIALILGTFWYVGRLASAPVAVSATLGYSAIINAVLGGFNLFPAFPLDGGRVLRGTLWSRSKNLLSATVKATRVSEVLSLLMIGAGFVLLFLGDLFNGIWIIFLGWFIRSGAETDLKQTLVADALGPATVGSIMTKDVLTVPPDMTVARLVSEYFLVHPHGGYPVVLEGKVVGIITMASVRSVPTESRSTKTVKEVMAPFDSTLAVKPDASALDSFHLMARTGLERLIVADGNTLLGLVTRGDMMKTIKTRQELGY
jgi:Zn-dependent protease/CBS domain-containing protein